jgi:anthranilate phosphoribosyltransferase
MNSAAAIVVSGRAGDFRTAFDMAAEAIDSGKALKKLEEVKRVSNSLE